LNKRTSINSNINLRLHKEKEMADFRKWLFAFAVVALVLGLQVPANAQFGNTPAFTCTANAGVPPIVRSEGVTELVGDLLLNCTGGTPTAAGAAIPLSNIQIFLNTNVTSRLMNSANLSEAILTIDEPFPAGQPPVPATAQSVVGAAQTQLACQAINSTNCAINGVGAIVGTTGPVGANGPYSGTAGHYNVFQGFQNGVNSVAWLGVPIDSPGTNPANQLNTRVIRITNVRANACLLGVSSTLIPTQIVMYISVNGSQQVTINNPQQTVAFIQPGLVTSSGTNNFSQCNNLNAYTVGLTTSSSSNGVAAGPTYITATEGFASSFKVRSYDQVVNASFTTPRTGSSPSLQNVLGFPYNTESGFVSAASGLITGGTGSGAVGLADTGTQITVGFTGIGAGVSLFAPSVIYMYPTGASSTCSIASTGCSVNPTGVAVLVSGTSGTTSIATPNAGGTTTSIGFGNVTVSGTTASVTYEVVASNVNVLEALVIPVWTGFISNTTQSLPGLGQSSGTVNFAPLSASPTATTGPIPRFCQPHTAGNLFAINICSCNLLFPFVTNQAGFDTGVAIANTSLDPFGTATQAGTVKLNYYGGTTGGGAAPAAQTSTSVAAGTELVFTLSNGGDHGIAATPGFQGYIIAQAQFQYCHAFAFISDLGAQRLAEGYLAIQLDAVTLNRTGVTGENKGN
jgi:hypothetical protein